MLGHHVRENNSTFLFIVLIDSNPEGSEISTILCQVPSMKDDSLKTSVNHPAEAMSAQAALILRSPFNPINYQESDFP
jgi:hypothetical protein